MINFSTKEYDLNTLLSFETLKSVLLELAKSKINLEEEIKYLKEENKNIYLKFDDFQKEIESLKDFNRDLYNKNNINKDENNKNNENETEKNIEINSSNLSLNKFNKKENIFDKELSKNQTEKDNNIEQNDNSKLLQIIISDDLNNNNNNKNITQTLTKLSKQINELNQKINILEENYKNELKNRKEDEKTKNLIFDNEVEFKKINTKINSLILKNDDFEKNLESIQSNLKGLDILKMFKDDGSGTIDATKVMVKSLQEKVFKKFELVETRYKKDIVEISKIKTIVDNLIPKLDKINNDFKKIDELNNEQKEEFNDYKNQIEEKNKELINNINEDFIIQIQNLKDEIYSEIKNSGNTLEEKIKNKINSSEFLQNNNSLEKESIKILEKKINDLRKKTNDLENTLKLHLKKNEYENIKKELKDIKTMLEAKITKEDLKELYNYHLTDLDEINDIKDKLEINEEEIKKVNEYIRTAIQKIEIFEGNLLLLQNNKNQPGYKRVIDFSRYVEQSKLNEALNPIIKKTDEILKEIDSIRRDMNEIENINKSFTKNSIIKFEEENTNKIIELRTFIQKKYLEKYDFNRIIKPLEVQIKALNDETKKNNSDTWLLAKRNTKCFNCATCETNIKNENYATAEYLPWKKYPKGEKTHRMGQGFSHMLEMVSSEFAKNIEKNEFENENNNINNNSYINTSPEIIERASSTKLKINNKYLSQEENIQYKRKKFGKMKLPKMSQSLKNYKNILINSNITSDDDKAVLDGNNTNNENEKDEIHHIIEGSPKIIRIIKKGKHDLITNYSDNFKTIQEEKSRIDKDNDF